MGRLLRRFVTTAAALLGGWLISTFWIPGIAGHGVTLGAVGIAPLLAASVFVTLVALLGPGWLKDLRAIRTTTRLLAAGFGTLLAVAIALTTAQSALLDDGVGLAPDAIAGLVVALLGGSLALVALARVISIRGVGNGLALFLGLGAIGSLLPAILAAPARATSGEAWLAVLLLLLGWGALVYAWVRGTWRASDAEAGQPPAGSMERLRVAGIGTMAMGFAASVLQSLNAAGMMFPADSLAATALPYLSASPFRHALSFVALSYLGGLVWTGYLFDVRPRAGAGDAFDARVLRETRGFLFGAPVAVAFLEFILPDLGAPYVVPILFFPVVATVMDTVDQARTHLLLARREASPGSMGCGECDDPVGAEDLSCPYCGVVFAEGIDCAAHSGMEAVARCVLCERGLCEVCDSVLDGCHLCAEHRASDLVDGWVTVAWPTTRALAEEAADALRTRGIEAMVLANVPTAAYGTLGLYDLRELVPLAVHPRLLGSVIRVLVPARSWRQALLKTR